MSQSCGGRAISALLGAALGLSSVPGAAGVLSPELETVLVSLAPDAEVAVIIELADLFDAETVSLPTKRARRSALVRALRANALRTEAPVRAFLTDRGASRAVSLWAIGDVATTVPARWVRPMAELPGVTGVRLDGMIILPETVVVDFSGRGKALCWI